MLGLPDQIRVCLFDLYATLTQTAAAHAAAWKEMFDEYLRLRAEEASGWAFVPFDLRTDDRRYVDGEPRADGTRSFRASRGIELPEGSDDDPADAETVHGPGNRKNPFVLRKLGEGGARVFGIGHLRDGCQGRGAGPGGGIAQRELRGGADRRDLRAGRFGWVVGVVRVGQAGELRASGGMS